MFTKTPVELLLKDFSNLLNKCQSVYDLVLSRRYNENLAILTTAEAYAIAEKPMSAVIKIPSCKQPKWKTSSTLSMIFILN